MKPGDHPEFFRFPAPEGRSRESTIVLDARGRFHHDGAPVEHPRMSEAFFRWLQRHPDDGRYILSNGYDWTYVTVEGLPMFVRGVKFVDARGLVLLLADGSEAELSPLGLRLDEEGALVARLNGDVEARFSPQAQTELGPFLEERDGVIGTVSGGRFVALPWPTAGAK